MEAQDAAATYFFKVWEWVENNVKTVIIGAGVVIIAAIILSYYFWHQNELEVAAGQTLSQFLATASPNSDPSQLSDSYLKIANDYPGTKAGNRALMLSAGTLFTSGNYSEAQTQFQKYLSIAPNGPLAAAAALGVAASLDAQGKTDQAVSAYQRIISSYSDYSDANAVDAAKFALGRIDEQRGKLADAEKFYQDVARNNPNSLLGSEAALRVTQLGPKAQTTGASNSTAAPFNLSHP